MIRITSNRNLQEMTTFGLPAECGRLIEYDSAADLRELFARGDLADVLPLGGGSNMLFTTGRFDGTVIHSTCRDVAFEPADSEGNVTLTAMAGCTLDHLCSLTAAEGLWGLENLSGIPGEIGGAAVQNVGAYGTEFKDVVLSVKCFDTTSGNILDFDRDMCRYGYRDSVFKHQAKAGTLIVISATLRLSTRHNPRLEYSALAQRFAGMPAGSLTPAMLRQAVMALRDSKLPNPAVTGSAGSFFKNPVVTTDFYEEMCRRANISIPAHVTDDRGMKLSAAWLIDHAGCKPLTAGGAALWQQQPLVIVNATGKATGADVVALENAVRSRVLERFGVDLHPEVIHIS